MCLFGINDVLPSQTLEIAYSGITMIVGAIVLANCFAILAIVVAKLSEKQSKFQEQVDTANTAMTNVQLDSDVTKEVIFFVLSTQTTQDAQEEF